MAAGDIHDDPNRQSLGLDPAWVEGTGGDAGAEPKAAAQSADAEPLDPDELPGRHAPLDDLAREQGHEWSRDDLTVAEKKAELAGEG